MYLVDVAWTVLTHFTINLLFPIFCVLIVFDFIGSLMFGKK